MFGLPCCLICYIFRNRGFIRKEGIPTEEGISFACRLLDIFCIKCRTVLRVDRFRTVDTAVYVKRHGIIHSVVIDFNLGRTVRGDRRLRNAFAAESGLNLRDCLRICVNISYQLNNTSFPVLAA